MKRIFVIMGCLALICSCISVESFDFEKPPHLSNGGLLDPDGEGEDDGDYELDPDEDEFIVPEDTWADKQPTGSPMTVCFMSYNVGKFSKYKTEAHDGAGPLNRDSYQEVKACIDHAYANVVGLNEVNAGQQTTLAGQLGSNWSSQFAYANSRNYGNAILYDKTSAVVKNIERVAIPKTADAGETRSLGVIEFEDYVFCVTHLDHKSDQARKDGAKIITDWVREKYGFGKTTKPVFLVGDMNCNQNASPIKYLEKYWTRISVVGSTFPGSGQCIDFIFIFNNGIRYELGTSKVINRNVLEEAWLASDHFPVYAEVTFNKQK